MFKFNPFTGTLDIVGGGTDSSYNFSFQLIIETMTLTVPEHQQMTVQQSLTVQGQLIVDGSVWVVL